MIIHSLLQQMSDDGFGTVGQDLQMGVLPLTVQGDPRNGIAVTARGSDETMRGTHFQNVDFYVRNSNPLVAAQKAQEILDYLKTSYTDICTLPPLTGVTTESFTNVTITPVSSPEYVGVDDNNGTSYVVSGVIRYKKLTN